MSEHSAENGLPTSTEYRVMWFCEKRGRWFSHTDELVTDDPSIAAAWERQARHRGGRSGLVETRIESREVTPWTTTPIPPGGDHA